MSFLKGNKPNDSPFKIPPKRTESRKVLPLPVLSMQTHSLPALQPQPQKKVKFSKTPIRDNFKKMLEALNKPDKQVQRTPLSFCSNTTQSRDMIRKRTKSTLEFYQSKVEHLLLRTEIVNAIKKIQVSFAKRDEQAELQSSKLSGPNLQRTIRFRKRSRKSFDAKPNRFMKWENFCKSISCQAKQPPTLDLKNKLSKKIQLKKRCESSLSYVDKTEEVRGWDQGPVRYATDVGRMDFSDIYE